jgi:hypothetical protein
MSNPYYTNTPNPVSYSQGRSGTIRDEYNLIYTGFDAVFAAVNSLDSLKMPKMNPTASGAGDFSSLTTFNIPNVASTLDDSTKAANTHFVQQVLGASGALLPPQSGQDGKALSTSGGVAFWSDGFSLPNQTGQDGKYLTTSAGVASWTVFPTITWTSVTGKPNFQYPIEILVNGVSKGIGNTRVSFNSSVSATVNGVVNITPIDHTSLFLQGVI